MTMVKTSRVLRTTVLEDILRMMFEREYAFSVSSKGIKVNVGHRKGEWTLARLAGGEVEFVAFSDGLDIIHPTNPVTGALLKQLATREKESDARSGPARALTNLLSVWLDLRYAEIEVKQPWRNSLVDENGAFVFDDERPDLKKL